jgi:hypothetical protein
MAALSLSGATSAVVKSPWLAFFNVPIPALVAGKPPVIPLALDAASGWKTPDITGTPTPTPFFAGCTKSGWQGANSGGNETNFECDEFTTPIFVETESTAFKYESELLTILSAEHLMTLFGLADLANATTNEHYAAPATFQAADVSFLLLSRRLVSGTYKYNYIFAPSVKQTAPFGQSNFTRKELWSAKLSLSVQAYAPWGSIPYTVFKEN